MPIIQHATALAARVHAVNEANRFANELAPRLQEMLLPFVGTPIIKAAGGRMKKFDDAIKRLNLPNTGPLSVHVEASAYTLWFTVKTCEQTKQGHAYYHESTISAGSMRGQVLAELTPWEDRRTDWTEAEVTALREAHKIAFNAERDARSALFPFGEYDR